MRLRTGCSCFRHNGKSIQLPTSPMTHAESKHRSRKARKNAQFAALRQLHHPSNCLKSFSDCRCVKNLPMSVHEWQLKFSLREWQNEAKAAWHANDLTGVVSVVTGGGKTLFAEACMSDARSAISDLRTVIIVPTISLLDQWYVSLLDELAVSPTEIATFSGGTRTTKARAINLMVLNTARHEAPPISEAHPTFLIVDECHRAASTENSRSLRGPHRATLGLSATPQRDYDDLFNTVLAPSLGPIIYEYDYSRARRDGVISPFNLMNVRFALSSKEQERYDAFTKRIATAISQRNRGNDVGDRIERLLRDRASVSNRARIRIPITVRLVEDNPGSKIIVFHEEIRAANEIVGLLRKRGRRAAAFHSGLGMSLRRDNLRQFRNNQIDVLVTCRALDEGINVPDSSMAIISCSTASTRQRIQRLGRVLRPSPGKSLATIYTLFATDSEEKRLQKEEQSLDGAESIEWLTAGIANG